MATNKNAVLRYNVLDKCFSNFGRTYYFDDLLEIVNEKLREENPKTDGIKTRQLREDIRFMRSDAGYSAPIETIGDRKPYYRYSEKDFSINKRPLNTTEAEQLKNAISVLQRFEGSPQFEWLNEVWPMLQDQFGLKQEETKAMSFQSNIDYAGYKHIGLLFNAITNKRVVKMNYQPFGKEAYDLTFHPYFLKQFNHRWFCFGKNEFNNHYKWNIALDRIQNIEEVPDNYEEYDYNWEDYFEDIIGVSRQEDSDSLDIELLFTESQAPYIQTKPIHLSQKAKLNDDGTLLVKINIIPNYELEMLLLSFGENVTVLKPESLKKSIKARIKSMGKLYKK